MHNQIVNGIPVNGERLVESVAEFNRIGQTVPPGHFNADRVGFYTGMQLEEMAETITAISKGVLNQKDHEHMLMFAGILDSWGKEFKSGKHYGAVLRADREELLDGGVDVAVVTIGSLCYQTPKYLEAISAVLTANAEKAPGGIVSRDQNGKIMKPEGWKAPNLAPFVDRFNVDN